MGRPVQAGRGQCSASVSPRPELRPARGLFRQLLRRIPSYYMATVTSRILAEGTMIASR